MAEDIQALADELAKLNKNNTLWAQPQIQSGAAAMMSQNQVQLQPYMQNFANATPGSPGPGSMFADPRAANYALQQQLFLNPYRAQAYGGEFGGNMPGAEYATSSRFGIYRPGQQGSHDPNFGQPGFMGDVATLTGFKSYAGYQDPYKEQIDASRRMTQRMEMGVGGALEVGGLAASFAPGVGLAGGLAIPAAAAYASGQYFSRRNETGKVHDVMQDLVSGSAATGLTGRGVGMRTASEMMLDMRRSSAADPTKSVEDYYSVLETGAATGLFNYEDSGGEVMGKVKKAAGMVNTMMMLAEDPDIQSSIKRMADFQAMGVSIGQMDRMATDIKAFAGLANTSFENVMSGGAAMGAQQAQMMGGSTAFGMRVGGMAQGMANRIMQSGQVSPEVAAMLGGKSGIMQSISSVTSNEVHSRLSSQAGAFMNADGSFNSDKFQKYLQNDDATNIQNAISGSQGNLMAHYRKRGAATVEAEASMTGLQTMQFQRKIMKDQAKMLGISEDDVYSQYGDQADIIKASISDNAQADYILGESRVLRSKSSQRRAQSQVAGRWWNRGTRAMGQFSNELFDSEVFNDMADREDRMAAGAAGGIYRSEIGDTSWMSDRNRSRYRASRAGDQYDFDTSGSGSWINAERNTNLSEMRRMHIGGNFQEGATSLFDQLGAAGTRANELGSLGNLTKAERDALERTATNATNEVGIKVGSMDNMSADQRARLLLYSRDYMEGGDSRKIAIDKTLQARGQSIANSGENIDLRKASREAEKKFGSKEMHLVSNLMAEGLSIEQIQKLDMGGASATGDISGVEGLLGIESSYTQTSSNKLNRGNYSDEVLGMVSKLGASKKFGLHGLSKEDMSLINQGDSYYQSQAGRKGLTNELAQQFAYSNDFDVFATPEEMMKQASLQDSAEGLDIKEKTKAISKAVTAKLSDDPSKVFLSMESSLRGMYTIMSKNQTSEVVNQVFKKLID